MKNNKTIYATSVFLKFSQKKYPEINDLALKTMKLTTVKSARLPMPVEYILNGWKSVRKQTRRWKLELNGLDCVLVQTKGNGQHYLLKDKCYYPVNAHINYSKVKKQTAAFKIECWV